MSRKPRPKKLPKANELYKVTNEQNNKIFITPKLEAKTESQKECIRLIKEKDIIFIGGAAGVGKSWITVAYGLLAVIRGEFDKLILVRPAVTTEEIGFLSGDLDAKTLPFMESVLYIVNKFLTKEQFAAMKKEDKIEIKSMAYIRGVTCDRAFIVVDEAQNLNHKAMKLIVTRIGEGSKLVIQGDTEQSDLKSYEKGSLESHIELFRDFHPKFGSFQFKEEDIVRNPLITIYLNRLKNAENKNQ